MSLFSYNVSNYETKSEWFDEYYWCTVVLYGDVHYSYYHVFAVTTTEEVFIYSSNSVEPLFYISNIHYAQICDFAWYSLLMDIIVIGMKVESMLLQLHQMVIAH